MTEISNVKGVGPAITGQLTALGIKTATDLAKADPADLTAIPRVGPARALMLIAAAREVAEILPDPEPLAVSEPAPALVPTPAASAAENRPGRDGQTNENAAQVP